ncbi:MAG: 1-acyl-sn-glycerol-3-phosphate acyltransferase [Ktedonobacteraceae bacterium]|nr:1-acyl-sn-glycerol-3-phosphate acyltransferase [Ktedonobacteraceae bacterium]
MKQETSETADQQKKPLQATKPIVNLYEPYVTPPLFYEAVRVAITLIITLIARLHVCGLHNVPRKGPLLLAPNHLAWTDIPLIPLHLPFKVVYMAKEEYFTSNIAWLTRFLGAFPVKRGEGDRQALRTAEEQLKKGNVVIVFPEGTRSRTRTLAQGHAGLGMIALRTGVPVIPVAIWGSENVLKKFGARVTICYGEPLVFKPKGTKVTREDIEEATETVMRKIATMLPAEYRGVYKE